MRKPAALILVFLCLAVWASPSVQAQSRDKIARWVEEVTLGPEFGGSGKICSRWVTTPTLSVFDATALQRNIVASSLAHLNKTLAKTPIKKIRRLSPNDDDASILVYFAPLRELPDLATQHGFKYGQDTVQPALDELNTTVDQTLRQVRDGLNTAQAEIESVRNELLGLLQGFSDELNNLDVAAKLEELKREIARN